MPSLMAVTVTLTGYHRMSRGRALHSAPVPLWVSIVRVSPGSHICQVVPATNQSGDDNVLKKRRGGSEGRQDVLDVSGGRRSQEPAAGGIDSSVFRRAPHHSRRRDDSIFPG